MLISRMRFCTALLTNTLVQAAVPVLGGIAKESTAVLKPRIFDGEVTGRGEFPYIAGVEYYDAHLQGQTFGCPAVLLNPYTVLTVSLCDYGTPYDQFTVEAGYWLEVEYGDWSVEVNVTESITNNSLALVHLASPIDQGPKTGFATLPEQGYRPAVGSDVTIVGWGVSSCENEYFETNQTKVTIPVNETALCKTLYDDLNGYIEFTDDMFCAGVQDGSKGGGSDTGSPVVGPDSKVVGLWWGSNNCGDGRYPDLMINVGDYVDWIKGQTWEA